jgi:hypothetical protein
MVQDSSGFQGVFSSPPASVPSFPSRSYRFSVGLVRVVVHNSPDLEDALRRFRDAQPEAPIESVSVEALP